jgi:hypothetical protein
MIPFQLAAVANVTAASSSAANGLKIPQQDA